MYIFNHDVKMKMQHTIYWMENMKDGNSEENCSFCVHPFATLDVLCGEQMQGSFWDSFKAAYFYKY